MIGLDTNVLVRYFTEDDPKQSKLAREVFERRLSKATPGYISTVVLIEMVWVLTRAYSSPREIVADIIDGLLTSPVIAFENKVQVRKALAEYRSTAADFGDCLIGHGNEAAGCEATLTFDRTAAKLRGFRLLA